MLLTFFLIGAAADGSQCKARRLFFGYSISVFLLLFFVLCGSMMIAMHDVTAIRKGPLF